FMGIWALRVSPISPVILPRRLRVKGPFNPLPICRLILGKIQPLFCVDFGFRVPQAKPPLFTRRIDTLSPVLRQHFTRRLGLRLILCQNDKDRTPLPQRVLVNEYFILWQTLRQRIFHSTPYHCTDDRADNTEKRLSGKSYGDNRANARDKGARG